MRKRIKKRTAVRATYPRPALHPQTFHLECKSEPREVRKIEPFLKKVNEVARLDDGTFYRLLVAGTEAVNNGILHGNKSDPRKLVHVLVVLEKDCLILRVKDEGKGFRVDEIPDPLEEKNLLKTDGRGIFLMRSLMDKVVFHITDDGTIVELAIDLRLLR
ncbi:MAG: ATP-binding protein [Ignavibacteria bacterium]|nr:ATP-binding protein [Ignavibacteria bacterium]